MARDVVDDRFIGALHVLALTRKGLAHDAQTEHAAIQAGTINALLKGCYEGDITMAEIQSGLAAQGVCVGIGTLWQCFDHRGITRKKRPGTRSSRTVPTS
jgi:hypothetical protein